MVNLNVQAKVIGKRELNRFLKLEKELTSFVATKYGKKSYLRVVGSKDKSYRVFAEYEFASREAVKYPQRIFHQKLENLNLAFLNITSYAG